MHKIANRLVGLYGRQTGDVWAYQGVLGDGRFNEIMQNFVGPTLVAMATKFGLGADIQLPTGLCLLFFCHFSMGIAYGINKDVMYVCMHVTYETTYAVYI